MRAMVYRRTGGPEVIEAEELSLPEPGPGEVLVEMRVSGVNPTDWKARSGTGPTALGGAGWQIPGHDGAGVVTAVGDEADPALIGQRVWVWEAAYQRPWGTAARFSVVPETRVVPLGPGADFELGAALGVPFLTAHRCLTVASTVPGSLAPGALAGRTVLVAGGAGAVGNAAIQLARWAGATVVTTVSSAEKAALARAAGADHVINYREQDVVESVRHVAPGGVDVVVEVAAAANAGIDVAVLGLHGTVAVYAGAPEDTLTVPVRPLMALGARWQFVLLYTEPLAAKLQAVKDIQAAIAVGAIRVGPGAGLPLHRFPLDRTPAAHEAVATGAVGKVLLTIP